MFIINSLIIGFIAGILASYFGIGGSVLTTPAIRIMLSQPANVAIGTPLLIIIPTVLSASIIYLKEGLIDFRLFKSLSIFGLAGVIIGAVFTIYVQAELIMMITAVILIYIGIIIINSNSTNRIWRVFENYRDNSLFIIGAGFFAGFYSGFLGLGGGTILVPLLTLVFKLDFKKAIPTSLAIISFYAIPGAITHTLIGNVRLDLSLWLVVGVIPGTIIGAKFLIGRSEKTIKFMFGLFLIIIALYFLYYELIHGGFKPWFLN